MYFCKFHVSVNLLVLFISAGTTYIKWISTKSEKFAYVDWYEMESYKVQCFWMEWVDP